MTDTKTALVVGASRGLGLGLVKQLSAEGWQVIATVREPQRASQLTAIAGVRIEKLDMNDRVSLEALAQNLAGTSLDLLFINAGVSGPAHQSASQATTAEVADLFMTNAVAPIRLAERLVERVEPTNGVLVFMTSALGSVGAHAGDLPLYSASKAALNSLTRSFVLALGKTSLTVLSMHPGWVRTDMGGEEAPLDVETSCRGMVQQVARARGTGGHRYIDYQGESIPW